MDFSGCFSERMKTPSLRICSSLSPKGWVDITSMSAADAVVISIVVVVVVVVVELPLASK